MSKRSAPGGYPQSDGDFSDHDPPPPPKKPYQPPTLSRPGPSGRTFQLPPASAPVWTSSRSQPAPKTALVATSKPPPTQKPAVQQPVRAMPTPVKTPDTCESQCKEWETLDGSDGDDHPDNPIASKHVENRSKSDPRDGVAPKSGVEPPPDLQARRRFYVEGKLEEYGIELNEVRAVVERHREALKTQQEAFELFVATSKKRHDELHGAIIEMVGLMKNPPADIAPPYLGQSSKAPKVEEDTNLLEEPSHEELRKLQDIVSRVCTPAAFRARSGTGDKRKERDNSVAAIIREVFYNEIGVKNSNCIRPPMKKPDGTSDLFPEFLKDPFTGRCTPCPDWDVGLPRQVELVNRFVRRFLVEAPALANSYPKEVRERVAQMTTEDVVIRLHDGVYRSAQQKWRDQSQKGAAHVEAMQVEAKRNARLEKKASNRAVHRPSIPSLDGSEWDFVFHKGAMSPEVSDEEGGRRVEEPSWRAQWLTNVLHAMDRASIKEAKKRRGFHPPLPCIPVPVSAPAPVLPGKKDATVRIAICGLSRKWRQANPELTKAPHIHPLFDVPPNINDFLKAHPLHETSDYDADDEDLGSGTMMMEDSRAEDGIGGFGEAEGVGELDGDVGDMVGPGQEVSYETGGEQPAMPRIPRVLVPDSQPAAQEVGGEVGKKVSGEQPAALCVPRVLISDSQPPANFPACVWAASRNLRGDLLSAPSFGNAPDIPIDPALQGASDATGMATRPTATHPQPELQEDDNPSNSAQDVTTGTPTCATEWSRLAHPPMPPPPPPLESQAASQVEAGTSQQPTKRGRGRPKGSKNKVKVEGSQTKKRGIKKDKL
ncbi:hypothetical protein FRC12_016185 [Ceratobasidium sp. 428]|nr:hypothetical protein FRC12_016185 [Ceratobasidium sp. 428]